MRSKTAVAALALIALLGCDNRKDAAAPQDAGESATRATSAPVEPAPPGTGSWKDAAKAANDRGIRYLREHQAEEGRWKFSGKAKDPDVGISALCLLAMMESPRKYREDDGPFIRNGTEWLAANQKEDGSIHAAATAGPAATGTRPRSITWRRPCDWPASSKPRRRSAGGGATTPCSQLRHISSKLTACPRLSATAGAR